MRQRLAAEEGRFAVRGDAAREFTRLDVHRRPTPEGSLVDRRVPDGREPRGTYAFLNDTGRAHVLANASRYRELYPDAPLPERSSAASTVGWVFAYVRVSARDRNPRLQLDAMTASGYDELVTEKESGRDGIPRPEWEALLARPQAGDTLKFWKSDRWGRSAAHVLTAVNDLRRRGVKVAHCAATGNLGFVSSKLERLVKPDIRLRRVAEIAELGAGQVATDPVLGVAVLGAIVHTRESGGTSFESGLNSVFLAAGAVTPACAVFTGPRPTAVRTLRAIPGGVPMPRSAARG